VATRHCYAPYHERGHDADSDGPGRRFDELVGHREVRRGDRGHTDIVPIGTLTFSEYPEAAQQFVDFVASEEGLQIFEEHGFIVYPNAEYEN
jgi:ABC-type molybdate transport system substrate-binding protein